jgi:hypothetical protein
MKFSMKLSSLPKRGNDIQAIKIFIKNFKGVGLFNKKIRHTFAPHFEVFKI